MSMTVKSLIEQLSDLDPHAEVRIGYQPSYPLGALASPVVGEAGDGRSVYVGEDPASSSNYLDPVVADEMWA